MRAAVARRDGGVCRLCGLDCAEIDNRIARVQQRDELAAIEMAAGHDLVTRGAYGLVCIRSAWEVDHVIAVEDGGATELANLATLCRGCHAYRTDMQTLARTYGVASHAP